MRLRSRANTGFTAWTARQAACSSAEPEACGPARGKTAHDEDVESMPRKHESSSTATRIALPKPTADGPVSVERALLIRRTVRTFDPAPLTLGELGQLLFAAQGETADTLRAAPSAGALYPLEILALVGAVQGLAPGLYRYEPDGHTLTRLEVRDSRAPLARAALDQDWLAEAPAVLVLTARFERTTARYGERGVRYVYMEAGHAAENVCLEAAALGLGAGLIGAFEDAAVRAVLKPAGKAAPLYLLPIGRPRSAACGRPSPTRDAAC